MPITRFPADMQPYHEALAIDPEAKTLAGIYFAMAQEADFGRSLRFVKTAFLIRADEVKTWKPIQYEAFILGLHGIMGDSLMANSQFTPAGEYMRTEHYVLADDYQFPFNNPEVQAENAEKLRQKQGDDAADKYLRFITLLEQKRQAAIDTAKTDKEKYEAHNDVVADLIEGDPELKDHPGRTYFGQTIRINDFRSIAEKMGAFCTQLHTLMQADEVDVETLTVHCLSLPAIHPLANGNGRESRLLADAFRMLHDQPPIFTTVSIGQKAFLNEAFSNPADQLPLLLTTFVREAAAAAADSPTATAEKYTYIDPQDRFWLISEGDIPINPEIIRQAKALLAAESALFKDSKDTRGIDSFTALIKELQGAKINFISAYNCKEQEIHFEQTSETQPVACCAAIMFTVMGAKFHQANERPQKAFNQYIKALQLSKKLAEGPDPIWFDAVYQFGLKAQTLLEQHFNLKSQNPGAEKYLQERFETLSFVAYVTPSSESASAAADSAAAGIEQFGVWDSEKSQPKAGDFAAAWTTPAKT